jgi:hypothetical protein
MEVDATSGQLAFSEGVIVVPRQSGKTTQMLGKVVHRSLGFGVPQSCVYTAQTRGKAREKWADEHVPVIRRSIFNRLVSGVRYANDSEALTWRNGSRYGIEAPTETAGHGGTNDLAMLDEAFSQVDARVQQALSPTMVTRDRPGLMGAQFYVLSTAGNQRSLYLKGKVDAGRARVREGRPSRSFYIEYSAADDDDPLDEEVWWRVMPALGYTITIEGVRAQLDILGEDEFRRAFLNQWPNSQVVEQVIPLADWRTAADGPNEAAGHAGSRIVGPRTFCLDVTPDRSWSAIGVAGNRADGLGHIEVVKHDRDTDWTIDRLYDLTRKWETAGPVVLFGAAAGALRDELRRRDVDVMVASLADQRDAAALLYDQTPKRVRHRDQLSVNTALAGAAKSESSGAWSWARKGGTDISPLCAVTGAYWGWTKQSDGEPLDSFYAAEEDSEYDDEA